MERRRIILLAKSCAVLPAVPLLLWGYAAGPDPGKSGVPGESTCSEAGCHVGAGLNQGGGRIAIDAGGTTYSPGVRQRITVTVSDPAQRKWGFQLTARLAGNPKARAGILAPIDSSTQILCANLNLLELPCTSNPVLQFIEHTTSGSRLTAAGAGLTFSFDWTPPAADSGDIILYAAGNASNGNAVETGDNIYSTTLTLTTGTISVGGGGGGGGDKPVITSVMNAASLQPGFSQNTWIAISGTGLAGSTRAWQAADFKSNKLPASLDGSAVTINSKPAFVQSISPTQVVALAPADASQGPVSVQVSNNGTADDAASASMAAFSPAFFVLNKDSAGNRYIAARHADFSLLGPASLVPGTSTPARPGEVILLFGTGFGPTNPAVSNGLIVTGSPVLTNAVTVQIGGVAVNPLFAGLISAGLYQINVQVPASAGGGDLPVVATIGGAATPPAFITVQQ
ncbi:MAG TPA: choice-of-anchor V domain-containing protein [Bryobacteraceae bacterium]|nr:choice-of-anchor V domain-containing protein [Bryobacteraceae bacterium]